MTSNFHGEIPKLPGSVQLYFHNLLLRVTEMILRTRPRLWPPSRASTREAREHRAQAVGGKDLKFVLNVMFHKYIVIYNL